MKFFYVVVINYCLFCVYNNTVAETTTKDTQTINNVESTVMPSDEQRLKDLTIKVNQLKEDQKSVDMAFQRESTKRDALKKALLGDKAEGCYDSLSLDGLEILINGSHKDREATGKIGDKMLPGENPEGITIAFGAGLEHSYSESDTPALTPGGKIILGDKFKGYAISDIKYISIRKGGSSFDYISVPKSSWKVENYETNIYYIGDITLKIGNNTIYKTNINKVFNRNYLNWKEDFFNKNSAYKELMRRTDCPQQ